MGVITQRLPSKYTLYSEAGDDGHNYYRTIQTLSYEPNEARKLKASVPLHSPFCAVPDDSSESSEHA
jgi:hypothetical protein